MALVVSAREMPLFLMAQAAVVIFLKAATRTAIMAAESVVALRIAVMCPRPHQMIPMACILAVLAVLAAP